MTRHLSRRTLIKAGLGVAAGGGLWAAPYALRIAAD